MMHRDAEEIFGYTDGGRTKMQIYRREIKAGQPQTIPQTGWTGGLLILDKQQPNS